MIWAEREERWVAIGEKLFSAEICDMEWGLIYYLERDLLLGRLGMVVMTTMMMACKQNRQNNEDGQRA